MTGVPRLTRPPGRLASWLVGLAAGALAACGGGGGGGEAPDVFLAFSTTFAPFRSWPSFHSDGPADDGTFTPDVLGPRTQYINQPPARGAAEFPVGTVIVEARENADHKIFAGVKRGGGFNAGGAADWEWFELSDQPVTIVWRGVGPPLGDTYGGDPNGGCNACHARCAGNDYVCSPKLALGSL
ncbi:MAG TPA: hypothetical protein VK607_26330 [Kofleriaceae bacterium]|nr:hypothetical protein [Kofleriaceae bacterium]